MCFTRTLVSILPGVFTHGHMCKRVNRDTVLYILVETGPQSYACNNRTQGELGIHCNSLICMCVVGVCYK